MEKLCFFPRFAEEGAMVMICDKNVPKDKDCLLDNISFVECDVSKMESFKKAFEATEQIFGKVDVLVNNAGILKERLYEGKS
jgi:NAD(P)-dependent dehydrogenase (short-subunit alcohol dehydrogenase family)